MVSILEPMYTAEDVSTKRTCLRLGERARLFMKSNWPHKGELL